VELFVGEKCSDKFCLESDFHIILEIFYKPKWDRRLYFPSEGRRAENFFTLKNPTASAGFELANLGTKGQHATSRLPKPLEVNEIGKKYGINISTIITKKQNLSINLP
jgi:hypothetical protein